MKRLVVIAAIAAVSVAGCEGRSILPVAPTTPASPVATSPEDALRRLELSWNSLDTLAYSHLFTDDFVFAFAALDTTGNAWRSTPWGRSQELRAWGHMVGGGDANQPALVDVILQLDRAFVRLGDARPGHSNPRYNCAIRTQLALEITQMGNLHQNVSGKGLFYFVRGDSAAIPDEVRARLSAPDSTVWFIDRWEDETHTPLMRGPARAVPATHATLGAVKALYL